MADEDWIDLDTLHSWLDEVDRDIKLLARFPDKTDETIQSYELEGICSVLGELFGWSTAYVGELPERLGVTSAVLNHFTRMRGEVEVSTARMVAGRLKTFLRSLEGSVGDRGASAPTQVADQLQRLPPFTLSADRWVTVVAASDIKQRIAIVAELLDGIVAQINSSNLTEGDQALSDIERNQLIAVLETAIRMLQAPMIETGLLRKAGDMLRDAASKAMQKQMQEGLGNAARAAAEKLGEIVKDLV